MAQSQQEINRRETSIKVLDDMLAEQKKLYAEKPPENLNMRFGYDLKIMALEEGIEAIKTILDYRPDCPLQPVKGELAAGFEELANLFEGSEKIR